MRDSIQFPISLSFFLFATIEVSFEIDQIGRRVYDDDDEEEEKKAKKEEVSARL